MDDRAHTSGSGSAEGSLPSFEALFRSLYAPLCRFAWGYLGSKSEAEDAVQDAFVNAWDHRESLDTSRSQKAYLYASVRNRCLNVLEHREVIRSSEHDVRARAGRPVRSPDQELSGKELGVLIDEVVDELPERRREIFMLHRQHGLTYREIARLLDISIRTVETQIARSLDAFRSRLEHSAPEI